MEAAVMTSRFTKQRTADLSGRPTEIAFGSTSGSTSPNHDLDSASLAPRRRSSRKPDRPRRALRGATTGEPTNAEARLQERPSSGRGRARDLISDLDAAELDLVSPRSVPFRPAARQRVRFAWPRASRADDRASEQARQRPAPARGYG